MAQLERLQKSLETLKIPPSKILKQETLLNKSQYIHECNTISEIICAPLTRTNENLPQLLSPAIEALLILCDADDIDIRLVANDAIDKICCAFESSFNRLIVEFYREIERNGSSRSLRVALTKFSELCRFIRPAKYRAYICKLFPCIVNIIFRADDSLLQETLCQFMGQISQVLVPYASDKEISTLLNAYLPNLNSTSNVTRRSAAMSIVTICDRSRRPNHFFQWLISNSLNLLSTVRISKSENSEKITSGVFVLFKFMCPSSMKLLEKAQIDTSIEIYQMLFDNLIFIYQHLLTSLKYSTSNVVIVSALEALIEFLNSMPFSIYERIVNLKENSEIRLPSNLSRSPTVLSNLVRNDKKYESSTSIASSINYIENIDNDLRDKQLFRKAGISMVDAENDTSIDFVSESWDGEANEAFDDCSCSEAIFDQESDVDQTNSLPELKMNEFDDVSDYSSAHFIKNRPYSVDDNEEIIPGDSENVANQISIDHFNLGPMYSLEYMAKILCTKFLLAGASGQLISDDSIRVSIKSLALSCFASLVHINPEALFHCITGEQSHSQYLVDILLYANHADPNLKGCVALILGKFLDSVLSLPISYGDFVSRNFKGNIDSVQLNSLFSTVCQIAKDPSSIAVKQALVSFQIFLPKLLKSSKLKGGEILSAIYELTALKSNSYWLVKVELVNLLSKLNFHSILFFEQLNQTDTGVLGRNLPLSKLILEDILFPFAFDSDHRVRQATNNSLDGFMKNLCLNTHLLNNDPLNTSAFQWMLSNFYHQNNSQVFSGQFPDIRTMMAPLDSTHPIDSTFSLGILGYMDDFFISSNLTYFVKRFLYTSSHHYSPKSLICTINALQTLAKLYPPSRYSEAWQIDIKAGQANEGFAMATLFVDLLTKNQSILLDMTAHQNLLLLTIDLIEGIVSCQIKQLRDCVDVRAVQSETQFCAAISPHFLPLIQQYFLHLLKIIVAYSAIAEDNSAIFVTFIHNLHSKNYYQPSTLQKKRRGQSSYSKEKEQIAIRKELSSKSAKKQESAAYDPTYFRMFDFLRSYHRNKKVSIANKTERSSLLINALNCMAKLLEIIDYSFVLNYLEDFLVYLRLVFHLDPTATILTVKQLLKCIFAVNTVSLFVDLLNDQACGKAPLVASSYEPSSKLFKCEDINSLYNSFLSMPYIKLNDFYNSYRARNDINDSNGAFLTWLRERVQLKLNKTLNLNTGFVKLSEGEMKKLLTSKIQLFEPLVVKSLKFYTNTSDQLFQAQVVELLTQLIQVHVNYCALDSDNVFINFVMKQFEFLENVPSSREYEPLMKRLFYFLVILSNGHYISNDLVDIPMIIQLCDSLIANGHHQMALQGFEIIVDDIYYFKHEHNVDSMTELEATREVVLAYCFKLLDFWQSFDLLLLIVNYYRNSNRTKWTNLSIQIVELLTPKLMEGSIRLCSIQAFESLQSLVYRLCSTAFSGTINLPSHLFAKPGNSPTPNLPFEQWFAKILFFLKLTLLNLNETDLLNKTDAIQSSLDLAIMNAGDSKIFPLPAEDVFVSLLLSILQLAIAELVEDQQNYRLKPSKSRFIAYLLSHYNLSLAFIFQSGFFPKITNSAINLIGKSGQSISVTVNDMTFDFCLTNRLFLKLSTFYPNLTISWLNLLYILNYDHLPEALSKLVGHSSCDLEPSRCHSGSVNEHIIKRFSLILLCDYLTENLENVEYLSWLIINHLHEIIDLCYEMPIREFINAIHRKSSSSGLFLQAVNSRCTDLLDDPMFASKLLHCIERAHASQSLFLVIFLLERFLFNNQLTPYYTCSKYAESIASNRLMFLYDLNVSQPSNIVGLSRRNVLSRKDLKHLKRLLQHTSYVKLNFTVQMIKNKCYNREGRKRVVALIDPLSDRPNTAPEINKEWFLDIIQQHWSIPQRSGHDSIPFLNKLSNEDILRLIASEQLLIENFKQILMFLMEAKALKSKNKCLQNGPSQSVLAHEILLTCHKCIQFILKQFQGTHDIPEHAFVQQPQVERILANEHFVEFAFSFLQPLEYLIEHLSGLETLANSKVISSNDDIIQLLNVYSTCFVHTFRSNDQIRLIDLCSLFRTSLLSKALFSKLSRRENIHFQTSLINSIFFILDNFFILGSDLELPPELTCLGQESQELEHIYVGIGKMLKMFRWLETPSVWKGNDYFPTILGKLLPDIIVSLSHFSFVNSLIFLPTNLFSRESKQIPFWKEANFNGDFHTNTPIIGAHYLSDFELFKQFSFRISSIGFVNRIQFEEIWMTLLGVYSENLTFLSLAKQGDDLNENIQLEKMVVKTLTNLLLSANEKKSKGGQMNTVILKQSFGDRFELIRETLSRRSTQLTDFIDFYNAPLYDPSRDVKALERLRRIADGGSLLSVDSGQFENESEQEHSDCVDLYSCLHFLIDLYLQTMQVVGNQQNLTCFPLLSEISKSCLVISDLFVEKNQFLKLQQLLQELAKIVEHYEDELLNQTVILALAKTYSVLALPDELIELQKKLITKQHFLPTRVNSLRSFKYLNLNLMSQKDLTPICDYVCKHFTNDQCMPSIYCAEYVHELWSLSLVLLGQPITAGLDFSDKVLKGLLKSFSRSNKPVLDLQVVCSHLEELLFSSTVNSAEVANLNSLALKRLKSCTSQLNSNHLLKLYILTSYMLGPSNFTPTNDEMFMNMEQLSVIFDPLRSCNSLQASVTCQVMGHFLVDFFPAQDLLNKCIGEFLSNQQNHYKYLADILFVIFNKFHHNDTIAQDWVLLSLSSFTQLMPISHALWALTCFLMSASQNHWIRSSYPYFQHRFAQFNERDKRSFFAVCNNFYNEIKTDENKMAFITTFQKAACLPNSPYLRLRF